MFYKITILVITILVVAPAFSRATFLDNASDNPDATAQKTSFFSLDISPDDIFMKIRSFLTITPHKGTTTGLSINVAIDKDKIGKAESQLQSTKDYTLNYIEIVNGNIRQKTGVDVIAIVMFFWNNLYAMFATTFGLIKSVLPQ